MKVFINLGEQCNFSCKYCLQKPSMSGAIGAGQVNYKKLLPFLGANVTTGHDAVMLWGGEPLVYWETLKEVVLEVLQEHGVNPELGIWYDMEDADGYKERNGMPDNQTITDMCSAFICLLNESGCSHVGIYASYSWLTSKIDTSQLADYVPYWNAQWGNSNDFPAAKMWQFTDSLDIGGQTFDGNEYYE